MRYKNKFALIVASCTILFFGAQVEAQLISIGPAGVRVRGARGERFSIGRSGVHIRQPLTHQPLTRPHVQPQRHGVALQGTPYQPPRAHDHIHANSGHSVTTPRSTHAGNFIVTNEAASAFQTAAESTFASGDLHYAAQSVAMAIKNDRDNGLLHLFASHVYFAIGDYRAAAREMDIATRIVPISQWGAIIRNADRLASREHYETQFHQLHRYLDQNPTSTDARLVYGFYSAARGERRVASDQFLIVLNSQPGNELASRLNNSFGTRRVSIEPRSSQQEQSSGSVLIRNNSSSHNSRGGDIQAGQANRGVTQIRPSSSASVRDHEDTDTIGDGTLIDLVP